MQIGFNFTMNGTLEMVQRFVNERQIDYVELLIDNFVMFPVEELIDAFDCPVGFHIMRSGVLEAERDALERFAETLRIYIDALKPLYVSDHLLCFSHGGRTLKHLGEIDYADFDRIRSRVAQWQDLLGVRLYLENYPSIMDGGWDAPAFYRRLCRETGAGTLFDASNAVVAQLNCGAPVELWKDVIEETNHYHVAGYGHSFIEENVYVDSHDREMSQLTIDFLTSMRSSFDKPGATITYERDFEIDYDSISRDLRLLREIFPKNQERAHESLVSCAG